MSIVIYGDLFTFPDGGAATNRVHTYAKGFLENGINVHVICVSDLYYNDTLEKEGNFNGIYYYHPFAYKSRSKYFIVRRWRHLKKYRNSISIIKRINKTDKITAINSWSNLMLTHIFGKILSILTNAKLLLEVSEHPFRTYQGGFFNRVQGRIKFLVESSIADGILCISHFLVNFYKGRGVDERKLFLVPSTVDPHRFKQALPKPVPYSYIGYFGGLTFDRDNVDLLIRAFAKFNRSNAEPFLVMSGFGTDQEKQQILELATGLGVRSKVNLLPFLSREEILQYISNADILVMVRSDNFYTRVSYPSKLTEFLASSKPVISVNIGEIPMYLKDGVDVFLVEPGDVEGFADKLDFVWNNYDHALTVGKKGKQLTEGIFNYKYQAKRMISFINEYETSGSRD